MPKYYNILDRIKSASNLPAQSTRLYEVANAPEAMILTYIEEVKNSTYLGEQVQALIVLMLENGLRVSEVCSIDYSKIDKLGRIYIDSKKGSNSRIITSSEYSKYFKKVAGTSFTVGDVFDRFFFYRLFKKLGIVFETGKGMNNAVTHTARILTLKSLNEDKIATSEIARFIGHKNQMNTKKYINKKSKKDPKI